MKSLQSSMITDDLEFSPQQKMLELSGKFHNRQEFKIRSILLAVSFAEGFKSVRNNAF